MGGGLHCCSSLMGGGGMGVVCIAAMKKHTLDASSTADVMLEN